MLRNLVSLVAYLAVLGAFGVTPLLMWLGAVVFVTGRGRS